jgi:hypothetical protein
MEPELKSLLEQNLELAKENNRLLRSMRRAGWFSALWRILWWGFLILSSYYLYQQVLAPWFGDVGSFHMPSQAELEQAVQQYQATHQ